MGTNLHKENFELIGKYLSKEIKLEEQIQFDKWLNESDHNREELNRIHKYTAYLEANIAMREADVDKARILTDFKIWKNSIRNEQENERLNKKLKTRNAYRIAAVMLLLIANAFVLLYIFPPKISSGFTEVISPLGSRTQLKLADGTTVWLNAGSTLKYANNFSKENRFVHIEGEAFFEVTHDSLHPFVVNANSVNLTVLGTTFNIRAYPDENTIETTLVNGKVEVQKTRHAKGEKIIVLRPNEKAIYVKDENKLFVNNEGISDKKDESKKTQPEVNANEKAISKDAVQEPTLEVKNTIAWKEGLLVFDNEPLSDIIVTLSRRYNVIFTYSNKDVLKYRFTGKFKETTLEQVLQVIMLTSPLEAEVKQNQVSIKENTSLKKKYNETNKHN
jgi:transmembrane sensor